jgi:hypothetical protein
VLGGRVRFAVECTDAGGHPCQSVELRMNGALLASGKDGLDTTVSLAGQPAGPARFLVTATSSSGGAATLQSPEVAVRPDTGWIFVAAVGGTVLDANEHWAVYLRGDETLARNLATGAVTQLDAGPERPAAWATRTGAVIRYPAGAAKSGIPLLDGAGVSTLPDALGVQVRGDWVAWWTGSPAPVVWRENVVDRRRLYTEVPDATLSDDGTLTYRDDGPGDAVLGAARADGSREVVARENPAQIFGGIADGPQTLYTRGAVEPVQVVLRQGGSPIVLLSINAGQSLQIYRPGGAVDLRDGWALWAVKDFTPLDLMTRAPSGEVRRVDAGLDPCCWSLGWGGRVLMGSNGHTYLASPPYTSPVDLGVLQQPPAWHEGHLFLFLGNSIFRSSW